MALAACKIPINDDLVADIACLVAAIRSFEKVLGQLATNNSEYADIVAGRAIDIDKNVEKVIQSSTSSYRKLTQEMATHI